MKYINYTSGVYKIVDFTNEILYVGKANDFMTRCKQHLAALKKGNHDIPELQKYVDEIGLDNLSFVVVEPCRLEHLDIKEAFYIKKLKPLFNYCHVEADDVRNFKAPEQRDFITAISNSKIERAISMDEIMKIVKDQKIKISSKMVGVLMQKMGFVKYKKRSENNKTYYLPKSN